jgi:alpha-D-glucose phosphate-specific phosphoglucomutase
VGHSEIKFGTDGWRAVIGDTYTFKNLALLSQAFSLWVHNDAQSVSGQRKIAIGYDTRFMSKEFAQLVAQVLAANNIPVLLSEGPIPTPALSYGAVRKECAAGIMITASHNPYQFNGFKIKTAQGGGAGKNITDRVEEYLEQAEKEVKKIDFKQGVASGKIAVQDFKTDYLKFLKSYLDLKKIKNAKFKVLTDAMHGSGNGLMAEILKGSKVRLTLMRADVNPYFDGKKPEPVVEFLQGILARVKKEKFDLGLVLDGDADRIAAVASGGDFIHPQKILGLLVLHLVRNRGRKGGIVKTICGTTMMDNIAKKLGVKLYETPVGFKYISDLMVNENIVAGGEEAGGMGFQNYIPERDGTLAGLLLLEMMVYQKKNMKKIVEEMEKEFGRYYYQRFDLKLEPGKTFNLDKFKAHTELLGKKVVEKKDFDGVKLICEDESWLMLRPSGTEPLVRAYSESKSLARAKELIKYGEALLKE